jgi:hypothetical protein
MVRSLCIKSFRQLLGNGGAALRNAEGKHVTAHGPENGNRINTEVIVKVLVFGSQKSMNQGMRNFFVGNQLPLLLKKLGNKPLR